MSSGGDFDMERCARGAEGYGTRTLLNVPRPAASDDSLAIRPADFRCGCRERVARSLLVP